MEGNLTLQKDVIVDILENRVRFFGTTGKILLPCPATVATLIQQIPTNKLITTDLLRKQLSAQFNVQGTCPVTTRRALVAIANDANSGVLYWRAINQNGRLMANYPGGVEGHAALLSKAGFTIDTGGKVPKVKQFKESLFRFEENRT